LSRFEHAAHHNEGEAMKAIAHLLSLDVEIVHHQSSDGLAEQISINLKAVPSFEAFARSYETMNPFVFWAEATDTACVVSWGRGHACRHGSARSRSVAGASARAAGQPPRSFIVL
jgi:hypothetical protein